MDPQLAQKLREGEEVRFEDLLAIDEVFKDSSKGDRVSDEHIEKTFGTQLRDHAIRISRERYALRQEITRSGFQTADSLASRRQNES